jgi:5-(carboxyamino)imidazole ribonucleotide synthase
MVNCIGVMPSRDAALAIPGAHLHDYGKSPRPGRKLGHITVIADDDDEFAARFDAVGALITSDG